MQVVAPAVKYHGQRQQDIQVTEDPDEVGVGSLVQPQVFRKAEQHDVAKGEAGDAKFIIERAVDDGFVFLVQVAQVDGRRIADAGQQLNHLSQAGLFFRKGNIDFLLYEVDGGCHHAGAELIQVFQQPEAGRAVDLRYEKGNLSAVGIRKVDDLFPYIRVVEEGICFLRLALEAYTGVFVQIVIPAQAIVVENFENRLAAFTAKYFILKMDFHLFTGLSAVVTMGCNFGHVIDQLLIF